MNKMNPVVHFEMPAEDRNRMTDFYKNAFGWRSEMLGPEMGEYTLVTTTETGENGRPKNPGAINGGFYKKSSETPIKGTSVVIQVDDLGEAIKNVSEAGGKVIGEADDIPGVGSFIYFEDTEGNIAGMLQPVSMV